MSSGSTRPPVPFSSRRLFTCLAATLLVGLATAPLAGCGANEPAVDFVFVPFGQPPVDFVRVVGRELTRGDGSKVRLAGVTFETRADAGSHVPLPAYEKEDYASVRELGMNVVTLMLPLSSFESSNPKKEAPGFAWLARQVDWARESGVLLVLGFSPRESATLDLARLWDDRATRDRFVRFWMEIAARHALDATIVGYDLANSPEPTRDRGAWTELAARAIAGIRRVDPYHVVFVDRAQSVGGDFTEDADRNFVRQTDPNVVYDFVFDKPLSFTHQGASSTPFTEAEARYPDASALEIEWFFLERRSSADSAPLPPGNSAWKENATEPVRVDDASWVVGRPLLVCDGNSGAASFDDLVVERLAADGVTWEAVVSKNPNDARGFHFWSEDGRGSWSLAPGYGDAHSIRIEKTLRSAHLGADSLRFRTEVGRTYRFRARLRGEDISGSSRCGLRLEFLSSKQPLRARDRDYVRAELDACRAWAEREGVPLRIGEFGSIRSSHAPDRGGLAWTGDVVEWALENEVGFSYRAYRGDEFTLFPAEDASSVEQSAYEALREMFRSKLAPSEAPEALTPPP